MEHEIISAAIGIPTGNTPNAAVAVSHNLIVLVHLLTAFMLLVKNTNNGVKKLFIQMKTIWLLFFLVFIHSCVPASDVHREEGKIFHASIPNSGAVGGLYFALYNDHSYQICSTGGVGQYCYEGQFILNQDTLVLLNLSKDSNLKSNKLLISRYPAEQYGSLGEVTQLDSLNREIAGKNELIFSIRMDSLINFRQ